jgi:hypothetical protein
MNPAMPITTIEEGGCALSLACGGKFGLQRAVSLGRCRKR